MKLDRYVYSILQNSISPVDIKCAYDYLQSQNRDYCIEISVDERVNEQVPIELVNMIKEDDSDLISYFTNLKLFFLDSEILREMEKRQKSSYGFEIDYSVMLDSNYASYIRDFIRNPKKLDRKSNRNLDLLLRHQFRFDYTIYLIETFHNTIWESNNTKRKNIKLYDNLVCLELFKNIDIDKYVHNNSIEYLISEVEAYILADKAYNTLLSDSINDEMKMYFQIHKMMTLFLIGMLKINYSSNRAAHNKMLELFEYMQKVTGVYSEREVFLAYSYFNEPNEFEIFRKIQKGMSKKNLEIQINNIAWDFSIPRIAEKFHVYGSKKRYYIPFILSRDANMKKVFNMFEIKGVIFEKDKKKIFPIPKVNVLEYLHSKGCKIDFDYFTSSEARDCRESVKDFNIEDNFKYLRIEIDQLYRLLN